MVLTIINKCNRSCPYCFEGTFTRDPRQQMSVADVDRICRFFGVGSPNGPTSVSLMGGEPTLHPELFELVDTIRGYAPGIVVFLLTNLICELDMVREIVAREMRLLVNVAAVAKDAPAQQATVARNLAYISDEARAFHSLAVTITDPAESFDFLYSVLARDGGRCVRNLRFGLAVPGMDFGNRFVNDFTPAYGEKYREVVVRSHQFNPRMLLTNECAVNLCLFSDAIYDELGTAVRRLRLECDMPNLDIMPDFSSHWCFAFRNVPEMRIDNIFAYRNAAEFREAAWERMVRLLDTTEPMCDHRNCTRIRCRGPCPALNYYRKFLAGRG